MVAVPVTVVHPTAITSNHPSSRPNTVSIVPPSCSSMSQDASSISSTSHSTSSSSHPSPCSSHVCHDSSPFTSCSTSRIRSHTRQDPYHSPFSHNFVAGAVALSTAFTVMHPIDTIKTRLQAQHGKGSATMWSSLTNLSVLRSSFRGLFKGMFVSVAGAAPQGGMRLATYEYCKEYIQHHYQDRSPLVVSAQAATCGDLASSVIKVPREVITQRLQTNMYTSAQHAISSILRDEGIRGLYTGFLSTQCRDIPFMILLFCCYENCKIVTNAVLSTGVGSRFGFPPPKQQARHEPAICDPRLSPIFGGLSGAVAGFMTTPFDVVKTRIMTSTRASIVAAHDSTHRDGPLTMRAATRQLITEHGTRGLFIGALPRSSWWFCVCAIFFPTYEKVKSAVASSRNENIMLS